jgi:hypothetical protein
MRPAPNDLLGDTSQKKLSNGYAGTPCTGPDGETCGSCRHSKRHGTSNRYYYKCHHERAYRSGSCATDIKLKTPACEYWNRD